MDPSEPALVPPHPELVGVNTPTWQVVRRMLKSTISIWSPLSYEVEVAVRRTMGVEAVVVSGPAGVRRVMVEAVERYGRHFSQTRLVRPIVGDGLLLSEGAAWKRQRRMLAPAFSPRHVDLLLPHFSEAAEGLVSRLTPGVPVNLSAELQQAALDAAFRGLFSMPAGGRGAKLAGLFRGYLEGAGRANILDVLARAEGDFSMLGVRRARFNRTWFAEVDAVIAERRARPNAGARDLLDLLLAARDPETGEPLSPEEVREQSATMLAAGYETTARALFWTAYLLCLYPHEQDRIRAEVAAAPVEGLTGLDGLSAWPRLRQVLFEAMRLYPPVPIVLRRALAEDEIGGVRVKAGAMVFISPWLIHRHRKFWTNSFAFDPDRFTGKPQDYLAGHPFLPFGAGPHICIGATFALAEASLVLARLLSRYRLALADTRKVTPVAVISTAPDVEPWFRVEGV